MTDPRSSNSDAGSSILEEVNAVFRDVLDLPELRLTSATTAADVEDWDSLTHIQLVAAVEKRFRIRFTAAEIQGFKNVGDLCAGIAKKSKGA